MFVLFYKPPCGQWYVHSHKLYPTVVAAEQAANKFLTAGTPYAVMPVGPDRLTANQKLVGG